MFNVVALLDDASIADAVRAALAAAAEALPGNGKGRPTIEWRTSVPEQSGQPADLLLLGDDPGRTVTEQLAAWQARPAQVVLIVADLKRTRPDDLSAADDLLAWPAEPAWLRAKCEQWLRRWRALQRAARREDRSVALTRKNSALRRQLDRTRREIDFRNRHDGNLRQILARVDGITRLSQQISFLQLEGIVSLCVERAPELIGVRLVSLYLYEEPKRLLRLQKHNHPYPINTVVSLADRPNSPMALALARKELLLINEPDWAAPANQSITRPYAHRYATGNCVIAPLLSGDKPLGVLNLADKIDGLPFDELVDLMPIRQLTELLAASIRNIELYQAVQQQAATDGMTGLANHSTFMRELSREINRARRYATPLSLIIADVDSLKRINDQMGHLAGDQALMLVARQVVRSIRESDLAARYGGDEFALLLPSSAMPSARAVAERVMAAIAHVPIVHEGLSDFVTLSIGVGQYDGHSSPEQFIEQVDAAMYRAKQEGKNRIALWE